MDEKKSVEALLKEYEKLKKSFLDIGLVQQGTILPRTIQKEHPKKKEKIKTYGPYYQWTKKIKGRTVTNNLTPSQAKTYEKAIKEYRKFKNILSEMMAISSKILEKTTTSVAKRKSKENP
jgi:hypothetical protein